MKKVLYISPHLSTGGQPQFLLKKIELLNTTHDLYVIEYAFIAAAYVVQRDKIQKLLGNKFYSLGENKSEIFDIINKISPDIIHIEEIPEIFMSEGVARKIYREDRPYVIFETSHTVDFDPKNKVFFPDKFLFVSDYQLEQYERIDIPKEVLDYPIEYKERPDRKKALAKIGLRAEKKHILVVGLFTSLKNQGYVFGLARLLPQYEFHFVGNQAVNFESYWKPLMRGKPRNCIIWGERADIDNFYSSCDLLIFPSYATNEKAECNPLVVKEALGWKLKVLMFNMESYNHRYDSVETIDFLIGSEESDAEKVIQLLGKSAQSGKMKITDVVYENDSNRINFTYRGDSCNVRVGARDIDTKLPMYNCELSLKDGCRYWIVPIPAKDITFYNYPRFNGFLLEFYKNGALIHSHEVRLRNEPPMVNMEIESDPMDDSFFSYFEFFYRNVYKDLPFKENGTVIDLGAHVGSFTLYSLSRGAGKVIAVEPFEKNANNMKKTFSKYNNIIVENAAIYKEDGTHDFFVGELSGWSSLGIEDHDRYLSDKRFVKETVKTVTLKSLLEKYGIEKIDVLKMDVEGSEYDIFETITSDMLKNIDNILLEYHYTPDKNKLKVILNRLTQNDFTYAVYKQSTVELADIENDDFGIIIAKRATKKKIKVVHLVTNPETPREKESIEQLSKLKDFGIEYVIHNNEPYTKKPPTENCAYPERVTESFGDARLSPAHYGCFLAHKYGILGEFADDVDFFIVAEADCKITVPIEDFVKMLYRVGEAMEKNDITYFSFGDKQNMETGYLESPKIKDFDGIDFMYETNKIICVQCIMFKKSDREFLINILQKEKWHAADLWYLDMFWKYKKRMAILSEPMAIQADGTSLIDRKEKEYYTWK